MNKVELTKCYTLVAAGCSHTQGCAFSHTEYYGEVRYKWANQAIADKFGVECTPDFITNNLTWMAYLRKHLNIGKIFNLGYGGLGTHSTIRSLQNYFFNTPDLSNHLIIIQLQSPLRNEMLIRSETGRISLENIGHFLNYSYPDNSKLSTGLQRDFYDYFYDEKYLTIDYFYQLLFIQKLFEKSGAEVRMFGKPWYNFPTFSTKEIKIYDELFSRYVKVGYEKDKQGPVSLVDLFTSLNIIDTRGMSEFMGKKTGEKTHQSHIPTLHKAYGLEGDFHYSEEGNSYLAEHIADVINKKKKITGEFGADAILKLNELI